MPPKPQAKSAPELLSPAGNWDCLQAAVANGADAVYLGTKEFNARVYARNFSLTELGQAVRYCHDHGVRLYLTMNTLVKDHELRDFFNVLSQVYALGIEGVIVQHISFLDIIKANFPGLKVFMSTQAAIGNVASASLVKSADRIILPRELSLAEVKRIVDSDVNVEVFVHGALCYSYSGLCLFSSFVSERSGNRGSCAQLCRQKYNGTYPLSTKELCTVRRIPELIEAGISGFKIEGRMRSALYVAVATRLYRKAIDSYLSGKFEVPQKEMAEIEVVFNRQFTEGLLFGETDLISPEKPMNRGAYLGVVAGGGVALQRAVAVGDGVGIWGKGGVTGTIIRQIMLNGSPVKSAAPGQKVDLDLAAKDDSHIYLTSSTRISITPDFTINRPPIETSRRKPVAVALPQTSPGKAMAPKLLVKVYSLKEAMETLNAGADVVFYDIFSSDFPDRSNLSIGAYLPRILNDEELSLALTVLREKKPAAILTGNLGFLAQRHEFKVPAYLDYSLNTFNDLDILFSHRHNVTPMLSPELSLKEMAQIHNKDAVIFCHGDIVLVNTKIEPKDKELTDEKGSVFLVRREASYWQILNSRPFGVFNDVRKLCELGFSQFFIDRQGKGPQLTALYRRILQEDVSDRRKRKGHTSGHLYRPVM